MVRFPSKRHREKKCSHEENKRLTTNMPLRFFISTICFSSATNRILTAKDHASVQINIGKVDADGRYTGEYETVALCGFIRRKGLSDQAFYRLVKERKVLDDLEK